MKSEWKTYLIDDICEKIYSGGTPNKKHSEYYSGGNIPWLNTSEIKFNRIFKTEKFITENGLISSSAKYVPENTVIVAMYGATAARTAIAKIPLTTNQACCNLIVDKNKADYRYVYYWLCYKYTQLASLANGGAQQNLNVGQIKNFPINIPSLSIQIKISNILYVLDDLIYINNMINENLEQQAQAIFKSWFVDFEPFGGVMPNDWSTITLGNIASISTKSINPLKQSDLYLEHYSIPAFDEQKYPVFEYASNIKSNKYILNSNSVMISKLNPETKRIWRPFCLSENPVCSTEFIVYEAHNTKYKDYIYSIIDSQKFLDYLCSHVTGSTNSRQRATPKATLNFNCVLPNDKIINEFCGIVTPMYEQIAAGIIENKRLSALRDTLLPKLMNGEIDVSNVKI